MYTFVYRWLSNPADWSACIIGLKVRLFKMATSSPCKQGHAESLTLLFHHLKTQSVFLCIHVDVVSECIISVISFPAQG